MKTSSKVIIEYHEKTKHYPNRYARSAGYLDWANEPYPFRIYKDIITLQLPLSKNGPETDYIDLYNRNNNVFQEFSLKSLALFLELSMGISAWISFKANSWALRINPSSGNLHPTECYIILPPLKENNNTGGVFHYNPLLHCLEERASFDKKFWYKIREHFCIDGLLIGLSSIYWRESWKYGERAFRYCNLDVGHAMACLSFSANLMGWKTTYLNSLSDQDIETMLGFKKTEWRDFEKEIPDLLFFVHKNTENTISKHIHSELIQSFKNLSFKGTPNMLSKKHVDWHIIEDVSSLAIKPNTTDETYTYMDIEYSTKEIHSKKASEIIRIRRSSQAYDGKALISKESFFEILDKTIPRSHCTPFDLQSGKISIHLL